MDSANQPKNKRFDMREMISMMMSDKIAMLVRVAVTACLFAINLPATAQGFDRGQALYENHCQECHTPWAHTRENRKVNSLKALRSRTAAWSIHAGLDWGREEIDDVTDYLNNHYYQLTE
jgi:mono/diheme cytochrome c family protein